MTGENVDRRVQRTRALLKRSFMQLVREKGYDSVTIHDITERANLGRTTFYLHYTSKDDLLLDHHIDFASHLVLRPLAYAELLGDTPPDEYEHFLQALADDKAIYLTITRAKDAEVLMRGVRQQMVDNLIATLNNALVDTQPRYALDLLANYIIGAQLAVIDWWLTNRTPHEARDVARMLHHLQRAAVRDAYGVDA